MHNAAVGVQRLLARLRPGQNNRSRAAVTLQRRSISLARGLTQRTPRAGAPGRTDGSSARAERLVPFTAVGLVAVALVLSSLTATTTAGPTGGTSGAGSEARLAIGGAVLGFAGAPQGGVDARAAGPQAALDPGGLTATASGLGPDDRTTIDGPFSSDGTLVKPVSVDTTVTDGKALMRTYRVKAGDTLTGIARRFGVSMMTVWWANDLKSKDDLHVGQTLTIPPMSGVVVTVGAADTLESLAARYEVDPTEIIEANQLDDPNLIVGQTLTIPGARSSGIATPKPKPAATRAPTSSGGTTRPPSTYSGGSFAWPVAGGYISQYFHYGHYGIDIAADPGVRVKAAAGGTVIFAGWKSNGGGYQVWIAHGSGLYTTYNHMMSVSVGRGQHVARGQQVGRIGSSGYSTGPHLHFEVWRGMIWDGGTRVNPLGYL